LVDTVAWTADSAVLGSTDPRTDNSSAAAKSATETSWMDADAVSWMDADAWTDAGVMRGGKGHISKRLFDEQQLRKLIHG
jgi:hypothetical protein